MGYTTDFTGAVRIEPPLNKAEREYLWEFSRSRRMRRPEGPYWTIGDEPSAGIDDYNTPADGQPQLWCQWVPNADGTALQWDGMEKFYQSTRWMRYLISTFLAPGCAVQLEMGNRVAGREYPDAFDHFTFDHHASGEIEALGQDGTAWRLLVEDNDVSADVLNGPAPAEYVVFMMRRSKHRDLDREFDAAFDIYYGEYLPVDATDSELAGSVRRAVSRTQPSAEERVADSGVEFVDDSMGLTVWVGEGGVRISLLAEAALPVWERASSALQELVAEIARESGWVGYDPARRIAVRPSAEFRRRAQSLLEGWVEEGEHSYRRW